MDTTKSEIYLDDIDMKVINLLKEHSKMLFIEPQGNRYKIKIEWNEQANYSACSFLPLDRCYINICRCINFILISFR